MLVQGYGHALYFKMQKLLWACLDKVLCIQCIFWCLQLNQIIFNAPFSNQSLLSQLEISSTGKVVPRSVKHMEVTPPHFMEEASSEILVKFNPFLSESYKTLFFQSKVKRKIPGYLSVIKETNMPSRYKKEFLKLEEVGVGKFGTVHKCIKRLDGCVYAVKRCTKPLQSSSNEDAYLREVHAYAVLGHHPHVIGYYSSWSEDNYLIIQTEYCNGGSLKNAISENTESGNHFSELKLKDILLQLALGLKYIHKCNLVHMDLKPSNIFIYHNLICDSPGVPEESENEADWFLFARVIYKIGDLSLVTSIKKPEVKEGDIRFLANEIFRENYQHLPKVDIFALGLVIAMAAGVETLPSFGDQWESIRKGVFPDVPQKLTEDFHNLLKSMIHPDPQKRPSAADLVRSPVLWPSLKTEEELQRLLDVEKSKTATLERELRKVQQALSLHGGGHHGNPESSEGQTEPRSTKHLEG
ncbi:wee1-like protein kinase 2 [Octodon degus]|uniref:Wee1-like protein kinase 2 n=1 Tax=Octodon degus TaxID=10160 RepID=A0A6P6E912_OCTDE|nr:wee1-like protein kinase 2 [Octodon degus]